MHKRLYRSNTNKMLGGICAGLADYFDLDPVLVRLIALVGFFASMGTATIVYIIAWIIVPDYNEMMAQQRHSPNQQGQPNQSAPPPPPEATNENPKWHSLIPGLVLVGLGALLLVREYVHWYNLEEFWPVLLILVGAGMIFFGFVRRREAIADDGVADRNAASTENGGDGV